VNFKHIIQIMRPGQWLKNLFCFAGLVFGHQIADPGKVMLAVRIFAAFCLVSSAVYAVNDIADREKDRRHPWKKSRPLAGGAAPVSLAAVLAVLLLAGGAALLLLPAPLPGNALAAVCVYLVLQAGYSLGLKHVVILDCLIIAVGFTLRAMAGAYAVSVELSHWLEVCSLLVALFMAFAKRRSELAALEDLPASDAAPAACDSSARPVLDEYSLRFLDMLIAVSAAITILSYILYTMDARTMEKVNPHLVYTSPLVLFGVLRYLYLVYKKGAGESPSAALVRDPAMILTFIAWCAMVGALLYGIPAA
jgi:4-hydroxybenzoate polyprenyltransferase